MALSNHLESNLRRFMLPPLLCVAVFQVASFSMQFLNAAGAASSLWLATGVPLAALLRSPRREWPALVAASVIGTIAASLHSLDEIWLLGLSRAGNNALEYCLCAWIVRRQCGSYFDLTEPRHLAWLGGASCFATLLKLFGTFTLTNFLRTGTIAGFGDAASWAPPAILGVFVLALPLLAISSRSAVRAARLDLGVVLLLLVLGGDLVLVFGPPALPFLYTIMPIMMMLGWRYGLLGAGLGAMTTVAISLGLSANHVGMVSKIGQMGYGAQVQGIYLDLFFIMAILSSLPLAILRARQRATDDYLVDAAAAAELRATQLAASEAEALKSRSAALQAKERLSSIIETSTDIICTLDKDGHFLEISENCAAIWGWPRRNMLGRPCFDFMLPDEQDDARRAYALRVMGQPGSGVQNHFVRPDGKSVPMSWSATWIEKDQVCHCIGRDMTEYNALAAQAQHAQKLESIGQLTGGIAHDFNNLLQIIQGTAELLTEKLDGDANLQPLANMTLTAARRGADLTSRLLSFSRRQTLVPKNTNVSELVSGMSGLLRRTLGQQVELGFTFSKQPTNAILDASQLENAILNLCINSRDAMPEGGRITIEVSSARLRNEDLRADEDLTPGEYISISLSDTGTGIAPENLQRVFEPFFTTKAVGQGSGLGLSMVFGFATQSHGCVRISSQVGQGTTVRLYLPAALPPDAAAETHTALEAMIGGNERILLVEDEALIRDQVFRQLDFMGYSIAAAADGSEALRLLNDSDDFDLVITDVMMPGGLNGWQLAEKIRLIRPRLPVLFMSGFADDAPAKYKVADADFHLLRKPFGRRELDAGIRQALATRQDIA